MNIAKIFNKLSEAEQAEFLGKLDRYKHERVFNALFSNSDTTNWKDYSNEDTYKNHSSQLETEIEAAKRIRDDYRTVAGAERNETFFYTKKEIAKKILAEVEAEQAEFFANKLQEAIK